MSEQIEPAFPTNGPDHGVYGAGMSLRDYFAAKAMQGLIATSDPFYVGEKGIKFLARDAYGIADAMLEFRI